MKTSLISLQLHIKYMIVAVFALFMFFPVFQIQAVTSTDSLSVSQLEAMVAELLETVAELKLQISAKIQGNGGVACTLTPLRNMGLGARGADVLHLQQFLNADPDTRIQVTAGTEGSVGHETTYFGSATADAVKRFQEKYRTEVLAPVGLSQGNGFAGAGTRAKMGQLCKTSAEKTALNDLSPSDDTEESEASSEDNTDTERSSGEYFKEVKVAVWEEPNTIACPGSCPAEAELTIKSGESARITWEATNATSCKGFGRTLDTSGDEIVTPSETTTYSITCTGENSRSRTITKEEDVRIIVTNDHVGIDDPIVTQEMLFDKYNVYSPHAVKVGTKTFIYFGGWLEQGQVNDDIYVAECDADGKSCGTPKTVIDTEALGFEHLNDPTLVRLTSAKGDYFIMYMTGVKDGENGLVASNNHIYYSTSWASDGYTWAAPRLLVEKHWLASGTVNEEGEVELYANDNAINGRVVRLNLGKSGVLLESTDQLTYGEWQYANPFVSYQADEDMYYMLGERANGGGGIDALVSQDGKKWTSRGSIIMPDAGQVKVRTPALHPDDPKLIYFGSTARTDSTANKIRFVELTDSPF